MPGSQSQNPPSNELLVKSKQLQLAISETEQILNLHLTNHNLSHNKHLPRVGHNNDHPDHNKELLTLIKIVYNMNDDSMIKDMTKLCETFLEKL